MEIKVIASGSSGNATLISDGATSLLLDAGISVKGLQFGTGFKLSQIEGCLVTHEHLDHCRACKDLVKMGMNVYASAGTITAMKAAGHRYKAIKPMEMIEIGTFTIMGFDVKHDAAEPLGYLIYSKRTSEKLIYFVDTAYVKYTFNGLTHIIAECNHGNKELCESVDSGVISAELAKRITKNHFSLERLIDLLKANDLSQVKEIHLVHLSGNNSNEKRFKQEIQRITGIRVYVH